MCCLCSCSGSVLLPEDNDLNDFRDNFSYVTNDSFLEAQIVFSDIEFCTCGKWQSRRVVREVIIYRAGPRDAKKVTLHTGLEPASNV